MIEFLKNNMLSCPFKELLNIECLGCGFQRSLIYLLEGNFTQSIFLYPALIPIILMLFYTILHIKFNFKAGHKWILVQFITINAIMIINYILKYIL